MHLPRFHARPHRSTWLAVALSLACGALAACSTGSADEPGVAGAPSAGFPVTIKNTFGSTTIPSKPERIVTLGWNAQDVVYALGQTPVGMPEYDYGADDNGVMPWDQKYFDADATELPDTTDGQPFEAIAKLRPDVILAPYEGFDEKSYDRLSKIAPTVAYPDQPWQTSWQDQTTLIGKALGKGTAARKLVHRTEGTVATAARKHSELDGKSLSVAYFGSKQVNVYLPTDPRVQILDELGFTNAPGVKELAEGTDRSQFFADLSWENVTDIDADVVVGYVDDMAPAQLRADKPVDTLTAVKNGSALVLDDTQTIAGLSQPTVLSVPWTLGRILPKLSEAAKKAS